MSNLENVQFVDQAQLKQVMLANADKADKRYIKKSDLDVSKIVTEDSLGTLAKKNNVGAEDLDATLAATIDAKADADDVYTAAETQAAISEAIGGLGELASLDEVTEEDLSDAVKNKINDVYTKTEVYTKDEAYNKAEVDAAIASQVATVYKPAGSATIESLPTPGAENLGYVFNLTEAGVSTEDFVEGAGQNITAGTNVVVVLAGEDVYKFDIFAGELDLSGYVKEEDITVASSAQIQDIIDSIYRGSDLNPDPEVVDVVLASNSSLAEISRAFNDSAVTEVNAKLAEDVVVPTRSDGKISTTMVSAGQTVNLDLNGKTINCDAYALYNNGGTINLTGEGTIVTRNLNTYGAIQNNGGTVNIGPGIVIDTTQAEVPEGGHNWLYGVVSKDGVIDVKGQIHTAEASCLAVTNGTMEGVGAQFIVEGDAVLTSSESSAIYLADNKGVLIKDNAEVGSIVMRMGDITVQDNAKVENTLTFQDDIPTFLTTYNGTAALPPAILLCSGCYKASGEGTNDASITIKDNATVSSANGEAVSVWRFDSLYDQNVTVDIEDSSKLAAKEGSELFKVYEYAELAEIATAGGKTMKPNNTTSFIKATVDGEVVYDSTVPEPTPNEEDGDEEPAQGE